MPSAAVDGWGTRDEGAGACPCGRESLESLVDDLELEHRALAGLLEGLAPWAWEAPSAAAGWTIADCVAHLAHTSDVAADTCTDGPRAFRFVVPGFSDAEAFVRSGVAQGRRLTPAGVLAWWLDASAREVASLRSVGPAARVRWGFGMSAEMFARARLMEAWAHGLDIARGAGVEVADHPRLRHVAALAVHALPYAYRRQRRAVPPGDLHLDLYGPDGSWWQHGPARAQGQVRGSLGELARVAVRRLPVAETTTLTAAGAGHEALRVIRAYL